MVAVYLHPAIAEITRLTEPPPLLKCPFAHRGQFFRGNFKTIAKPALRHAGL